MYMYNFVSHFELLVCAIRGLRGVSSQAGSVPEVDMSDA